MFFHLGVTLLFFATLGDVVSSGRVYDSCRVCIEQDWPLAGRRVSPGALAAVDVATSAAVVVPAWFATRSNHRAIRWAGYAAPYILAALRLRAIAHNRRTLELAARNGVVVR